MKITAELVLDTLGQEIVKLSNREDEVNARAHIKTRLDRIEISKKELEFLRVNFDKEIAECQAEIEAIRPHLPSLETGEEKGWIAKIFDKLNLLKK